MADVEVAVGFRRKARVDAAIVFSGAHIFRDDRSDKIERAGGDRRSGVGADALPTLCRPVRLHRHSLISTVRPDGCKRFRPKKTVDYILGIRGTRSKCRSREHRTRSYCITSAAIQRSFVGMGVPASRSSANNIA